MCDAGPGIPATGVAGFMRDVQSGSLVLVGDGEDPVPPRAKRTALRTAAPLNPVLRGWTNYFRHGVSKATFGYLRAYTWTRVVNWLRRRHPRANWKWLRRRYLPGWWPTEGDTTMFDPNAVAITYTRYRGQITDTTPWATGTTA
jgi:Group II intron, maturase-specific domain